MTVREWESVKKVFLNLFSREIPITLTIGYLFFFGKTLFDHLKSPAYWQTLLARILAFLGSFAGIFVDTYGYTSTTISLFAFGAAIAYWFRVRRRRRIERQRRWTERVNYDPNQHAYQYVSDVLRRRGQIQAEEEFKRFTKDFTTSLHNLFRYKSIANSAAWLKPESGKLYLYATNQNSEYTPEKHFSFGLGEGVAGRAWRDGAPGWYSEDHPPNPDFVPRESCHDRAYICSPIPPDLPNSPRGLISIGFRDSVPIEPVDVDTLKLMSTAFLSVLEGLPDDLKTKLDL
jgi:hypothetical protein